MSTAEPVLHVGRLHETFAAEGMPVRALRHVDLDSVQGEFLAIMGPSGCGRSTLLNLVAGLDSPTGGQVVLAGMALEGRDEMTSPASGARTSEWCSSSSTCSRR